MDKHISKKSTLNLMTNGNNPTLSKSTSKAHDLSS